jgi:phage-related protein
VADLIQNQLLQLAKQITEPIYRVVRALQGVFHDIVSSLQSVIDAIESVVNAIKDFLQGVESVANAIAGVFEVSLHEGIETFLKFI